MFMILQLRLVCGGGIGYLPNLYDGLRGSGRMLYDFLRALLSTVE